jgi:hypothetical protein
MLHLQRLLLLLLMLLPMEVLAQQKTLDDFFDALHWVEAERKVGPIKGDNGASLGPLQISKAYWQDSKVKGKYSDCANLIYSKRVAIAYFRKWGGMALEMRDWEILARIHNGGPRGYRKQSTLKHWKKVREELYRDR